LIFRGRGCGCFFPSVVLLVALGAVLTFHTQILAALGASLVKNDAPQKSDAVIALAGDDFGYRVLTAGRLIKEGWASYALISGTPYLFENHAEIAIAYAQSKGFPRSYFRPFEGTMVSTRDETQKIAQWLRQQNLHKILLVTSNYHTSRATYLMKTAAPWLEIRTIAAPDPYFTPDGWWKTRGGKRAFLMEWSKTLGTWLGY
jgi:uncharacterized SAM-binding protein YcdF (DUF218 family)